MNALDKIYEKTCDYISDIPHNTPKKMLYSFGSAFVIETIFTRNQKAGFYAGTIAFLACTIHAAISPLFKRILGYDQLSWSEEVIRSGISIIGSGSVAAAYGDKSVIHSMGFLAILYGILILDPKERNLNSTNWFGILNFTTMGKL